MLATLAFQLILLPGLAPTPLQSTSPVEMEGRCRGSGIGEGFLKHYKAQAIARPQCNLAVSIGVASLSFFVAGNPTPQVLFSGSHRGKKSFKVELVRVGAGPVHNVLTGNCLEAYRSVMCHAVFVEGGVRKGIALSFDIGSQPSVELQRKPV